MITFSTNEKLVFLCVQFLLGGWMEDDLISFGNYVSTDGRFTIISVVALIPFIGESS